MEIIEKICLKLNCTVDDILEILPDESDSEGKRFDKDNDKK